MTVYSIFNSQPDFLSRKQRGEWSTSVSMVKIDVISHCSAGPGELQTHSQSPLEGVGVGRADPEHSTNYSTRATLPPPHNSSRAHSPLPILISLPLAKVSPQVPLPPRAAAFIFFQVVNYNSRAKSTVNFYSLHKQFNILQAFVSVVQLPKKYSLHLPSLSLHSVFQFFSKHIPFTHNVRRLPNHAFFRKKKVKNAFVLLVLYAKRAVHLMTWPSKGQWPNLVNNGAITAVNILVTVKSNNCHLAIIRKGRQLEYSPCRFYLQSALHPKMSSNDCTLSLIKINPKARRMSS